jgi:hypothetical protein
LTTDITAAGLGSAVPFISLVSKQIREWGRLSLCASIDVKTPIPWSDLASFRSPSLQYPSPHVSLRLDLEDSTWASYWEIFGGSGPVRLPTGSTQALDNLPSTIRPKHLIISGLFIRYQFECNLLFYKVTHFKCVDDSLAGPCSPLPRLTRHR